MMHQETQSSPLKEQKNTIVALDSLIQILNQYVLDNKQKIFNNESGRRDDIKTIASSLYACLEVDTSQQIDKILSQENLILDSPETLPKCSSLNQGIQFDGAFLQKYRILIDKIKTHLQALQTGWLYSSGYSTLKSSIESIVNKEMEVSYQTLLKHHVLLSCLQQTTQDANIRARQISSFFATAIPAKTYIFFYHAESASQHNSALILERLSSCFRAPSFLDGKTSLQVGKQIYKVMLAPSKHKALEKLDHYQFYLGIRLPLSLDAIRELQQSKNISDILKQIKQVEVWDANNRKSTLLKVAFNDTTAKLHISQGTRQGRNLNPVI